MIGVTREAGTMSSVPFVSAFLPKGKCRPHVNVDDSAMSRIGKRGCWCRNINYNGSYGRARKNFAKLPAKRPDNTRESLREE